MSYHTEIRDFVPSDLEVVSALLEANWREHEAETTERGQSQDVVKAASGAPGALVLVACEGAIPVAYLWGEFDREGRSPSVAEICELFVRHDRRRRGIAKALVGKAVQRFVQRKAAAVRANARSDSESAIAFWNGMGFMNDLLSFVLLPRGARGGADAAHGSSESARSTPPGSPSLP